MHLRRGDSGLSPYRVARATYRAATGRYSRTLAYRRLRRSARDPRTFMEKVRYKMAFDRDPLLTTICDRIAVRDVVAERVGAQYLTQAYAIARRPEDIDWAALPREYVAKANHGSGAVVVVWDGADPGTEVPADPERHPWARIQVRPDRADPARLTALFRHWLSLDYSWSPARIVPEWAYQDIPRGIIVEERLAGPGGGLPDDYKVYVVHGRVQFTLVQFSRLGAATLHAYYDRDWTRIHPQFWANGSLSALAGEVPPLPATTAELVRVAETLGSVTDAVRVDLYALGSRVAFGELTPYQNAGVGHYEPRSFDLALGDAWHQDY